MSSFLTALTSVGAQYGEAKDEARKDKEARAEKLRSLDVNDAYLQLARQREQREAQAQKVELDRGDLLKIGDRLWSISKGKYVDSEPASAIELGKEYISKVPKEEQAELNSVLEFETKLDPNKPHDAVRSVLARHKELTAAREKKEADDAKSRKTDPIITAQIGKAPDPKDFPDGATDPKFRLASKKWGIEAETIKERIASSGAEARGKAYGAYRPGAYIDQEGEIHTEFAGAAIAKGWVPYQPGFQSMSRTQQIAEMQGASQNLRSAIQALQPDDAFDTISVAQLRAASNAQDPTMFTSVVNNLAASVTNPRQQDYLVWLQQMGERVLSLRNVAGMGQGAQDLRQAIQATLPGINSGSKEFAIKRLDAVDNQIRILGAGIPHTNINTGQSDLDKILDQKFGKAKP